FFSCDARPTTRIYPLSLHDALPIYLDGHVVDVLALEQGAGAVGPGLGLGLAEDRLTEEVDVEPEALPACPLEVAGEGGVVGVDDEVTHDLAQPPARQGHDELRGERGGQRARAEEEPVDGAEETGGTGRDA